MSVICRTFVQNTWRSDLCSNCFKSLEDHLSDRRNSVCDKLSLPRYVPQAATLYQSRGISTSLKWRLNESLYDRVSRRDIASQTPNSKMNGQKSVEPPSPSSSSSNCGGNSRGILIKTDSAEKRFRSRPSVDFASEEALVIGYGGNDYDSDTSPWEMGSDDGSIDLDLLDDTDEDRKITRLTRNNTEFNSFNKNLLENNNEPKAEDSSSCRKDSKRKEQDELLLNTINNNRNNNNNNTSPVKTTDKAISILTYNDIQSSAVKAEKKQLNQYFFPSSTDIKSYLNGRGSSLIIEEALLVKNNKNKSKEEDSKLQNNNNRTDSESKVALMSDDFTPLNTRTYSFVSELDKGKNYINEQSSDSDYSTCRHTTTGDSTDSESLEESSRPVTKSSPSSFLHGTYAICQPAPAQVSLGNDSDVDKKYDAGSSTSGDISNFSDDSDAPYEPRGSGSTTTPETRTSLGGEPQKKCRQEEQQLAEDTVVQKRNSERQLPQRESPKASVAQQPSKTDQKSKQQSPPSTKHAPTSDRDNKKSNYRRPQTDKNDGDVPRRAHPTRDSPPQNPSKKDVDATSKSVVLPSSSEVKRSPLPVCPGEEPCASKHQPPSRGELPAAPKASPGDLPESSETAPRPRSLSDENLIENHSKEHLLRDKELADYNSEDQQLLNSSDYEKSPDAMVDRQSKLAALALELELARRDSEARANCNKALMTSPPEVKVRCNSSPSSVPAPCPSSVPLSPSEISSNNNNYPTIKKASSAISCASRLTTLPDVLLQETPAKQKKNKFSLKKLLKRNKDSGTFNLSSTTSAKEANNPKAWKKQTFDRNRLSLEIVHPMDLTSDGVPSADSTPTEEHPHHHRQIVSTHPGKFTFRGVASRARSLSALPQLSVDDQSGCALIECRKMDTVPMRKAGTVAERKKSRPSLVRTPSCSALPNRSTSTPTPRQTVERAPPPKPPPPPKCKAMHPPPPPPPPSTHPRPAKSPNVSNSPARPPPPKVPDPKSRSHSSGSSAQELHEQNHSDKEYANLGDVRSLLTPKKPGRPSAFSARGEGETGRKGGEGIYETLPVTAEEEEEDHYTYLDEQEAKASRGAQAGRGGNRPASKVSKADVPACGRPWLDLQTSYAAIAAANYESLAELITTTLNESVEYFRKVEHSLKWRDFVIEQEEAESRVIKEKAVYGAVYKNGSQDRVTLVVAPRKQTTPQGNARYQTRYPVLASFTDSIPRSSVGADNYLLQDSEVASVYVLQRGTRVTTVQNFAKASGADLANQSIHLRNYCFVLLQLIHTLKSLQAEGVEEIHHDLQILVLVATDEEDRPPVLVLFPEDKARLVHLCDRRRTLCQATLETMLHFLQAGCAEDIHACVVNGEPLAQPVAHTFRAVAKVLAEEKASSLSQAKGFLEYMLWGPVDVRVSSSSSQAADSEDDDTVLQRWLDLQRAQMVKSTISHLQSRRHAWLHVYEEYQLVFLLQASVKSLKTVISKL